MKFYFALLFKRLNRHLKDFGIEPLIAYAIVPCLFYLASSSFFDNVMYPNYFYSLIALLITFTISSPKHDEFIKQHFSRSTYGFIKAIFHLLFATPFIFFLVYKFCYLESLGVFIITILISFIKKPNRFNIIVPTPFYRWPHEFTVGFRRTFWMYILLYGIAIIAIKVGNFNLGVFSVVSIFFLCSSYYMKPDPKFYIWIYAMGADKFLKNKIYIAVRYSVLLTLPILVILSVFYFDQMHIVLMFACLGLLYMIMFIVLKYALSNEALGMFQGIIGVTCLLFPPAMVLVMPYFYSKAKSNLNALLK